MPRGGKRVGAGAPKGQRGPTAKTKALRAAVQQDHALTAQATLGIIKAGALWDIADLFDKDGNLLALRKIPKRARICIAGFEVLKRNITAGDGHTDTVLKVRLVDRARYVEMAALHHGLLKQKIEVSGEVSFAEKIAQARARLQKSS
jgi:hypothetical protein